MELCFPRRGRYQQNSFGLATRFPFAFLTKTRRVPWPARYWCIRRLSRPTNSLKCFR